MRSPEGVVRNASGYSMTLKQFWARWVVHSHWIDGASCGDGTGIAITGDTDPPSHARAKSEDAPRYPNRGGCA